MTKNIEKRANVSYNMLMRVINEDVEICINLDPKYLKKLEALAGKDRRSIEDEAACLLEKGVSIGEIEGEASGTNKVASRK